MAKPDCDHDGGTHCIHSSERRSFRSCRRRWDWAYREHYVPNGTPKALEFGICFHEAMEEIFDPDRWNTTTPNEKLTFAIARFVESNNKFRDRFLRNTQQTRTKPENRIGDDYEERAQLGIGMITHYINEVHPYSDNWFTPVRVEVPFSVPLYVPEGIGRDDVGSEITCSNSPKCGQTHQNPAPCTLNGRLDALVEDNHSGHYYIADWKTAGQLIVNGDFLQMDDQITSYCAALRLHLDIDVIGFVYAEFKKGFPQEPTRLTKPYAGKIYSTSKQQDTTYEIARKTFEEFDPDAYNKGAYDKYLDYLQHGDEKTGPPKYHQRFPLVQEEAKYRNVLDNVAMEAIDMVETKLIYPAPSKDNCRGCAFRSPCIGKFNDEDYVYTLDNMFGRK